MHDRAPTENVEEFNRQHDRAGRNRLWCFGDELIDRFDLRVLFKATENLTLFARYRSVPGRFRLQDDKLYDHRRRPEEPLFAATKAFTPATELSLRMRGAIKGDIVHVSR